MKMLILSMFFSLNVFGHGMDSVGPNGGNITMPGTYHVELVVKNNKIKVYLLDVSFKNPITANSQVDVLVDGKSQKCLKKKEYFDCGGIKKYQQIKILSTRNKIKGTQAVYNFPLKY